MTTHSLHTRKLAAVGYVPLLGIVVLYGHRADSFIRFHAGQGVALSLYLAASYFLPVIGPYIALLFAGFAAAGFIHAVHGQDYRVPLLGDVVAWMTK